MSYDVWLELPNGKGITDGRNMTSNVARMWRHAGCDIAEFHGKSAVEFGASLRVAIKAMELDPATYRAMEPDNGWGSYDGTVQYLKELLADVDSVGEYPCQVHVWR